MAKTHHYRAVTAWLPALLATIASLAMFAPPSAHAAPPAPQGLGLGVNIHFTDNARPGETKMLAAGGFSWVRMDLVWDSTEKMKGQYDFSHYDRLLSSLDMYRIKPVFVLDFGNPLYSPGGFPFTANITSPDMREAMARWAAAAVTHFKGRGIVWEMWNEPNAKRFWRPAPNGNDYIGLAQAVCAAVKAAAPGETLMGPAASRFGFPFLEACFKAGLLNYWDAVSVHPYRDDAPETVADDYRRLRRMIARYSPPGKSIPIYCSEWGYAAVNGVTPDQQGKYLAREWLTNIANNVNLSIWYDWHDDGVDPNNEEHNFGTVANEYHAGRDPVYDAKPAYEAAQIVTRMLSGFTFSKRLAIGGADDYVLLFARGSDVRLAAWTLAAAHEVTVPASPGTFRTVPLTGPDWPPLTADRRGLAIGLSDSPVFVSPTEPNDLLRVAAAWGAVPLDFVVQAPRAASIVMPLSNPLSKSITVKANRGRDLVIAPGKQADVIVKQVIERSADTPNLRIQLAVAGMGMAAQDVTFVVTNPLALSLGSPVGDYVPALIDNPSGQAFMGSVTITAGASNRRNSQPSVAVSLKTEQTQAVVRLPIKALPPPAEGLGAALRDDIGTTIVTVAPAMTRPVDDFSAYSDAALQAAYDIVPGGNTAAASEQAMSIAAPPDAPGPADKVLKIAYRFAPGWKFLRLAPKSASQALDGRPKALSVWVYGDGSGNLPRLRLRDSTGQTFQPSGPPITWHGWRAVSLPLDGTASDHWGGANDGTVHYPIRIDTPFLLYSVSGADEAHTIYLSGPELVY